MRVKTCKRVRYDSLSLGSVFRLSNDGNIYMKILIPSEEVIAVCIKSGTWYRPSTDSMVIHVDGEFVEE